MLMPFAHVQLAGPEPTYFDVTAATGPNGNVGFGSSSYASFQGGSAFGSITDDTSPDGNTVLAVVWAGADVTNRLAISSTDSGLSSIFIDDVEYSLGPSFPVAGQRWYAFGSPSGTQRIFTATTYTIGLI